MWWLSLGACWFSFSSTPTCEDPHLWYAPDGSGDVYFGCDKPTGWLETPPDEAAYAVVLTTTQPPQTDTGAVTDEIPPASEPTDYSGPEDTGDEPAPEPPEETGETGDTGLFEEEAPLDTADTADTGLEVEPKGGSDSSDTGLFEEDTGDTGDFEEPFAGELEEGETGLPPEDTGLLFEDDGMGGGDTADTGL